jgi:hypothetical protein
MSDDGIGVATRLLEALARKDFDGMRACFTEDARLRALVPTALREDEGAKAIEARFRLWWEEIDRFELVESDVGDLADRTHMRYRLTGVDPEDGPVVVEQHAYLTSENGHIRAMDLVCSGFRPTAQD